MSANISNTIVTLSEGSPRAPRVSKKHTKNNCPTMDNWQPIQHSFDFQRRFDEISCLRFDEEADLLWCGDTRGSVASYSPHGQLHTRHSSGMDPVMDIITMGKHVVALSNTNINVSNRGGVVTLNLPFELTSGAVINNELFVGGHRSLYSVDLSGSRQPQRLPYEHTATKVMTNSRFLTIGKSTGGVDIVDPRIRSTVKSFLGHQVTDMDFREHTLVTVGRSGRASQDPFVNIYDLRVMKQLPPVPFPMGADFVRLHPVLPTVVVVGSKTGMVNFMDMFNPTSMNMYQSAPMTRLELSPTGDFLGLLSMNGFQLWNRPSQYTSFSHNRVTLEYPDYDLGDSIVDENAPLSSVGMPYYGQTLLSHWPPVVHSAVDKPNAPPRDYAHMKIAYSRYGVDEFNFDSFNSTPYSGLETDVDNDYTNSLVQLYRFVPQVYNVAVRSLASGEHGFVPELGYLFHMLSQASGKHVRSTYFQDLADFEGVQQEKMSLDQYQRNQAHIFNKFLLEKCGVGVETNSTVRCLYGHIVEQRSVVSSNLDVVAHGPTMDMLSFLERALNNSRPVSGVCPKCSGSLALDQHVRSPPKVLSLDLNFTQQEWARIKKLDNWLPLKFYLNKGHVSHSGLPYHLAGFVAQISCDSHLVTFVKIERQWFMFNDFLVKQVSEEEAIRNYWWKTPLIAVYTNGSEQFTSVDELAMDDSILYKDTVAESVAKQYLMLKAPLQRGTLLAIDAEFVVLNHELVEINRMGKKTLVKPKTTSLARLSVLLEDGTPIIDDYVITTGHIEDYVTRYSGILPGDLDPATSDKPLVARHVVYRKLWLLIQMGCVFVGHGLANDFRSMNIFVPQNQLRDTMLLYHQGKRNLSLRYLAYAVLGMDIQSGNHDSIEDAHVALMLYKRQLELVEDGTFKDVLQDIYRKGAMHGYRVPERAFDAE